MNVCVFEGELTIRGTLNVNAEHRRVKCIWYINVKFFLCKTDLEQLYKYRLSSRDILMELKVNKVFELIFVVQTRSHVKQRAL